MPYPDLTFRDILDAATRQELEQFVALLNGYLAVQHKDDGSHDDVTADSLAVSGDMTGEGDLSVNGRVTADADGHPVVLGPIALPAGASGTGVDIQGKGSGVESRWQLVAYDGPTGGGSNHRALALQDVQSNVGKIPFTIWFSGGNFYVSPLADTASSVPCYLGDNIQSLNLGRWPIYAKLVDASTGYLERGRSANLGEWATFAPTWTNLTVGNGTVTARYTQIGKTAHFVIHLAFGSTTSVAGAISVSTPTTMASSLNAPGVKIGDCFYRDDSAITRYRGDALLSNATTLALFDGANPMAAVTATNPFTFTTADSIFVMGTYEEA